MIACLFLSLYSLRSFPAAMEGYDVSLTTTSYGKTGVKLLFIKRDPQCQDICEFEGKILSNKAVIAMIQICMYCV